jgi:hypothetical protein
MIDNLNWPTLDRHDDRFDSQYRRQHTTRDHTRTKGNSWNNNTSYGTPRNAWNTQAPTSRITDQHNSWRATSNPFSTTATNQSTDHYYPFNQVNATPASIKLKDLTDIVSVCPLLTQEWNQWNVLNATIPKIQSDAPHSGTTDNKSPFMGMEQFSIFAWAKTHPRDKSFLNNWNNHFWPKLNNCKNKADARHVVNTEMFQPLLRKNPKLINCLHDDLNHETICLETNLG